MTVLRLNGVVGWSARDIPEEQGVHFLVGGGGTDKLANKTLLAILIGAGVQSIPCDL
jgi:hypothetical protein